MKLFSAILIFTVFSINVLADQCPDLTGDYICSNAYYDGKDRLWKDMEHRITQSELDGTTVFKFSNFLVPAWHMASTNMRTLFGQRETMYSERENYNQEDFFIVANGNKYSQNGGSYRATCTESELEISFKNKNQIYETNIDFKYITKVGETSLEGDIILVTRRTRNEGNILTLNSSSSGLLDIFCKRK